MRRASQKNGFTIVELLIVIVVIAILAAITIVAYNGVTQRARESSAQSAASQAMKKIATHVISNGSAPTTLDALGILSDGSINYQYSVNTNTTPNGYCVTASVGGAVYYLGENYAYTVNGGGTIDQTNPTAGVCPGHNASGIPTITNYAINPSVEVDLTGYDGPNSSTLARSTVRARTGAASLEVTIPATTSWTTVGATIHKYTDFIGVLEPFTLYTISAWVWVPTGTVDVTLLVQGSGRAEVQNPPTNVVTAKNQWTRIQNTFETSASGSLGLRVLNRDLPGTSMKFWVDDIMLVKGSKVYDYADGATPGWSWDGTVGKSSSQGPAK